MGRTTVDSLDIIEPKSQRIVVQHNALAEARYRLSLRAQKLLIKLMSELDRTGEDFTDVELTLDDFAPLAVRERNDVTYAQFVEAAEQFLGHYVAINEPVKHGEVQARQLVCHWISSLEKNPNTKAITFSFDKKLRPYLLGLKREFFIYPALYAFNLDSIYAIRLYQWVKAREYLKRPQQVVVDDFRQSMGTIEYDSRGRIKRETLKRYADFKRVAIKPAIKEVNSKTDLLVSLKEIKRPGTKIVSSIVFSVQAKDRPVGLERLVLPLSSQLEMPLERLEAGNGNGDDDLLAEIREYCGLSTVQLVKVRGYLTNHGLAYVKEKLDLTRLAPRDNVASFFLAALRDDWKAPLKSKAAQPLKKAPPPGAGSDGLESETPEEREIRFNLAATRAAEMKRQLAQEIYGNLKAT